MKPERGSAALSRGGTIEQHLARDTMENSNTLAVSNQEFLAAIFPDVNLVHTTSFMDDPLDIPQERRGLCWGGSTGQLANRQLLPGANQYFTISEFRPGEDGVRRRRKALFEQCFCIVADDVGEKLPVAEVEKLPPPCWKLETSPGSQQWGWILPPWMSYTREQIENLLDGLVAYKLAPDGRDPGMKGVTRYVRLPEGHNRKAKWMNSNGAGFKCRMIEWRPERLTLLEELAAVFDIDINAPGREADHGSSVAVPNHPVLNVMEVLNDHGNGKYDVVCPWVDEHTDGDTSGTAIWTYSDGRATIKCFHGHCIDKGCNDLMAWCREQPGWEPLPPVIDWGDDGLMAPGGETPRTQANDITHDALALRLGQEHGWDENARYVDAWGKWITWDGSRWVINNKLEHLTAVREFLRREFHLAMDRAAEYEGNPPAGLSVAGVRTRVKGMKSAAKTLKQASTVIAVETTVRSNRCSLASHDQFNANLMQLGTPGGTVDLETGLLKPAVRSDYITKFTSVTPAPGSCPLWLKFLDEIFQGDQDVVDFIQTLVGYALTGEVSEHKLFFLFGSGANGKSVFVNVLSYLFGEYSRRAPAQMFLDSKNDRHPTEMAGLQGARLVLGSELPPGKTWHESGIKDMTGGDTISARLMRQDFFEFKPQFTLLIAGNHKPRLSSVDEAIRRRMCLIPFKYTVPPGKRDQSLEKKLKVEGPAILDWAIRGTVKWCRDGLQIPKAVQEASDAYIDSEDVVAEFIREALEEEFDGRIPLKTVYEAYRYWCSENGIRQPWTKKSLDHAIQEHGYPVHRDKTGRHLAGYKLREFAKIFPEFGHQKSD